MSFHAGVHFSSYSVSITPMMKKALDDYSPDFMTWDRNDFVPHILKTYDLRKNQSPQAVFGDFNGDLTGDVVLWGRDGRNILLIAVLSYEKEDMSIGYKVHAILKGPPIKNPRMVPCSSSDVTGIGSYLTYFPPGKIKSEFQENELALTTDAFKLQDACIPSVSIYYYRDGRFYSYITGD